MSEIAQYQALILAQQKRIAELEAKPKCEICRDYWPSVRDDSLFLGNVPLIRDGAFARLDIESSAEDELVFRISEDARPQQVHGKQRDEESLCIMERMAFSNPRWNLLIDDGLCTVTAKHYCLSNDGDYWGIYSQELCSHTKKEWCRIVKEIKAQYGARQLN